MAAMLDIFDQEKVWEMALKAERREGREEGVFGIIRLCRSQMHLDDQDIIKNLMEVLHLSRDIAAGYLAKYDQHPSEGKQ